MSDKFYVGLDLTGFENNGKLRPISRVTLLVDDDNAYTAGDDTGAALEASCPHATQAMVDNILAQVKGYQYQAYSADDANIDPSAELGDGVTVSGVYSVLSRLDDDGSGYPSINAPGEAELEDEYPAAGPMTQEFNRKIAETRSTITKTAEEIRLEVENELDGLSVSIDVKLDSITSQITGLNGQVSTLEQTASSLTTRITNAEGDVTSLEQYVDSLTLSVSNGSTSSTITLKAGSTTIASQNITMSGLVTYTGLANGSTVINGGCIQTGTIDAEYLNLTGAIKFSDLSTSVRNDINDAYTMAEDAQSLANDVDDVVGGWTYRGTTEIDGRSIRTGTVTASTLQGGEVELLGENGNVAASFTLDDAASAYRQRKLVVESAAIEINASYGSLYLEGGSGAYMDIDDIISCGGDVVPSGGLRYALGSNSYKWTDLYCANGEIITSDRNAKKEINYELDRYSVLFDQLSPCSYQLVGGESGRTHLGMISQEIETAMEVCGISDMDFAAFIKSPKRDENGAIIEGEYDYALRYTEFIPLLIWQVQKLKARVSELEGNHG